MIMFNIIENVIMQDLTPYSLKILYFLWVTITRNIIADITGLTLRGDLKSNNS